MRTLKIATGVSMLLLLLASFSSLNAGITQPPIYQLLLLQNKKTVGLSDVQKQFVATNGYPQQFVKTFEIVDGQQKTNEIWTYITNGVIESFVNGQYISEKSLTVPDASFSQGKVYPEDYQSFDTPATIQDRHGVPLTSMTRQIWNGSITMYIYSNVLFHFNNGRLAIVIYSIQPGPVE